MWLSHREAMSTKTHGGLMSQADFDVYDWMDRYDKVEVDKQKEKDFAEDPDSYRED